MSTGRLKAKLSGGPAALSTKRPNDEFRILAAYPTTDGLLGLLEVETSDVPAVLELLVESPCPSTRYSTPTNGPYSSSTRCRSSRRRFARCWSRGPLSRFSLTVGEGCVIAELTTSHELLSRLQAEFDVADITYEVLSITQSSDPTDVLTERQRQFVSVAIEMGYYDTPRRCSLTDLADALDVSKSTASVVLHGSEERIAKSFMESKSSSRRIFER